jgi:hypothetical protein
VTGSDVGDYPVCLVVSKAFPVDGSYSRSMAVEDRRPFSWRAGEVPGGWRAPVPAALEERLRRWVGETFAGATYPSTAVPELAERVLLRLNLVPPESGEYVSRDRANEIKERYIAYGTPPEVLPDVVDAVLSLLPTRAAMEVSGADLPTGAKGLALASLWSAAQQPARWADDKRKILRELLEDALSVLQVRPDGFGLERRADPNAERAFGEAVKASEEAPTAGSAAMHLHSAWNAVHTLHPDPGRAYGEAIKAVEAAAHAVVEPNNPKATLGTMLGHLRANRGRFSLVIAGKDGQGRIEPLIGCMELLWEGQTSRHGSSVPTRVETSDEAAMAVDLAVMLVQWFVLGRVRRLLLAEDS